MHLICGMGVSAAAMTMVVAATGISHSSSKGSGDIISPAAVYLDGGSLAVLTSPCTDGDTLLECAQRYADSFKYPNATDLGMNSISTLSTNTCLDGKTLSAKLNVSWKARLNTCTVTPQIVYTAGGIYSACSEQITFMRSDSRTITQGFSVSTEISGGANVDFLSSSVKVTGTSSEQWSDSVTTQTAVAMTFNLGKGDICFPSTVQLRVDCIASVADVMPGAEVRPLDPSKPTIVYREFCEEVVQSPASSCKEGTLWGPDPTTICSVKPGNFTTYLNVPGGGAWALYGCTTG
ncbi:hypothetical protein VFPBJ_11263 [Purpureocillium lilacinum]|uniref:Sushi domain-containing protein n=1 Tax=Purpureocillium lilacinum TaxID=33203 RepID=A0A179FEY2_PURLI|nr:hypothetical protein VFPBJ_11263 [Purpureocillium lilacinum]